MSEFVVQVVRIGEVQKHPNADSLSITHVHGSYPVIFRTGDYAPGDLAVYLPVDSIVPDTPEWAFLEGNRRIKAKKLRGVFSMGLFAKAPSGSAEGDPMQEALGITKWVPPVEQEGGALDTGSVPECTRGLSEYDLCALRRHPTLLQPGEQVVITEKIHGANFRAVHDGERLHVGSRARWLKDLDAEAVTYARGSRNSGPWWAAAKRCGLASALAITPGFVLLGEVYGQVQDLKYGAKDGEVRLACFDVVDTRSMSFVSHDQMVSFAKEWRVPVVPELYRGPWDPKLAELAEGKSTLPGANHVREGIVIEPVVPRYEIGVGRVKLKHQGEGYLTRKGA